MCVFISDLRSEHIDLFGQLTLQKGSIAVKISTVAFTIAFSIKTFFLRRLGEQGSFPFYVALTNVHVFFAFI